jgi:uncharacterized repeat protein (TIGR03806 family)
LLWGPPVAGPRIQPTASGELVPAMGIFAKNRRVAARWLGPYRWHRWCLGLLVLAAAAYMVWPRSGLGARVVNEQVRLPLSTPGAGAYRAVEVFPNLRFFEPTCVVPLPGGSGSLLVLERRGTIQLVQGRGPDATKQLFIDALDDVWREPYEDDGALGLVLHPQFGEPGSPCGGDLFVFYTARLGGQRYDRLERLRIQWPAAADALLRVDVPAQAAGSQPGAARSSGSPPARDDARLAAAASPAARVVQRWVLIEQLDEDLWHNGGALAFGPDGFLYVGVGDEGGNTPDEFANGQRIDRDLFCGVLRIDVDCQGGEVSHPPPRQPDSGRTAHYYIPNDNPFVGVPGALEEFWATGLRNPHRMAFDLQTGWLWAGDVGQQRREEINLIGRGTNHQWSYAEGRLPMTESWLAGRKPQPYHGIETPPLFDYAHVNGNNCIIGGYVYRGTHLPELQGTYLYGDNGSGRIWALHYEHRADGQVRVVRNVELLAVPATSKTGLASIDRDADGEPLLCILGEAGREDGRILGIQHDPHGGNQLLPQWLSQVGVFADVRSLQPAPGVVPYDVNAPLWSDGATKRRWILLPGDGTDPDPSTDRIEFSPDEAWRFPVGTVFIKHFELPIDERDARIARRLETRLLVVTHDGAYGLTYVWNDSGTDAALLATEGADAVYQVRTADGGTRQQAWRYPSRAECMVCHNAQADYVLGVNARQLDRWVRYPGTAAQTHQLREWSRAGMFTRTLSDEELQAVTPLAALDDATAPLEHRVMSYLDANCAHCHRPGGVRAGFDARFTTPLEHKNLLCAPPHQPTGVPGLLVVRPGDPSRSLLVQRLLDGTKRMPSVGVLWRDTQAIGMLSRWIDQLPVPPELEPVPETPSEPPAHTSAAESPGEEPPVAGS